MRKERARRADPCGPGIDAQLPRPRAPVARAVTAKHAARTSEPRFVATSFKPTLLSPRSARFLIFPVWSRSTHHGPPDSTESNSRTSSMFIPRIHDASPKTSPRAHGRRQPRQFVIDLERLEVRTPLSAGLGTSLATHDGCRCTGAGPSATTIVEGLPPGLGNDGPAAVAPAAPVDVQWTCPGSADLWTCRPRHVPSRRRRAWPRTSLERNAPSARPLLRGSGCP